MRNSGQLLRHKPDNRAKGANVTRYRDFFSPAAIERRRRDEMCPAEIDYEIELDTFDARVRTKLAPRTLDLFGFEHDEPTEPTMQDDLWRGATRRGATT